MRHTFTLALLLLSAVSCRTDRSSVNPDEAGGRINLSVDVQTKGVMTTTANIREFQVYGYRQNDPAGENKLWDAVSSTATADLLWDVRVHKNGDLWEYDDPVSWDDNSFKRYAFFGYSPLAKADNGLELLTSQATPGYQKLKYQTVSDVTQQLDLVVSSRIDQTPVSVVPMRFSHVLSRVGFQAFTNVANTKVKSISISDIQYKGEVYVKQPVEWLNVSADKTTFTVERNPAISISTDQAKPTDLTGDGLYYFMLLPQDLSANTDEAKCITIVYEQHASVFTKKYTIKENYKAGTSTLYKVDLAGPENEALVVTEVIITDWVFGGSDDLSSTDAELEKALDYTGQPANSYITYPGKALAFKATLKPRPRGGSVTSKTTCTDVRSSEGLNVDIPLSSIKRVEVTWQTAADHGTTDGAANMIIQKIEYDPATGVCTVTPHATGAGNAVISAYDAGGTILWNWHIWVTNGTVGNIAQVNGVTFMDRNLGALAATSSKPSTSNAYKYFGVLYQHGRPTPFSGQGVGEAVDKYTKIYNGSGAEITGGVGGFTFSGSAVATVKAAIQNPNTHYHSGSSWYNFGDVSLWSDTPTTKSLYDPCPYGYRVPKNGSWNEFPATTWTNGAIEGGAVWSGTWWPAAGLRNTNSGSIGNVGGYGWYWSSTRYPSSAYRSYYLYFDHRGTVNPSGNNTRSYGFSVRCVAE